jgi:aspartyl-tRNA(Asn)/glutamyl-tRNA(Gln) amidotransferase subunit B
MPSTKTIANIITTNLLATATKTNQQVDSIIKIPDLITLASYFEDNKISNQGIAKTIEVLAENPSQSLDEVLKSNGLLQIVDSSALEVFVDKVIEANPAQVEQYRSGKVQIIGFLVGQCMKEAQGKGNPKIFNQLLAGKLG